MKTTEIAFEEMLREHKNTIYTVCYMFSKDQEEVNDLFQEVVINIWKGMPSFKGESNVKTWIWRISFNTCISLGRKKKRAEKVPLSMVIDLFNDGNSETRQMKQLYERIHRLQPFDRAIVLLWLEGLPYDEIGAIVGISTKNVSVRLYRIKEELKNMSNHQE